MGQAGGGGGGPEHCSAMGAGAPNTFLLSTRLSVKLASSSAHPFDVSSWEREQLGSGEGLQAGLEGRWDESQAV